MEPAAPAPTAPRRMRGPFAVVTTLFFLWGFITVMVDALVPRLKAVFELSYFEAAPVQPASFAAYLLLSIPSGLLIARVGYKQGVVVGLLAMGTFVALCWGGALVDRFLGAGLLQVLSPGRVRAAFAGLAIALLAVSVASGGVVAMAAILAVGLFNSVQFAILFTLAIDGLGVHTARGSGVFCTAIVGGAVVPTFYGALADAVGVQPAFLLLTLCYGTITAYGLGRARATPEVPDPPLSAVTV